MMNTHKHTIRHLLKSVLVEKRSHEFSIAFADIELEKLKDRDDIFIQFTDMPKVGLDPLTYKKYYTPAGIYMYPLKQVWNDSINFVEVPFASERKYINVFQIDKSVMFDVTKYKLSKLKQDLEKVLTYLSTRYQIDPNTIKTIRYRTIDNKDYMTDIKRHAPSPMWCLIQTCKGMKSFIGYDKFPWMLNGIFRFLGYKVITDLTGTGSIHSNEPTQAVSFSKSYINLVMTLENKISRPKGDPRTHDEVKRAELVQKNPSALLGMRNPSEAVQIAAVKEDPDVIDLFPNPSERVQVAAVRVSPFVIQNIENPCEKAQLEAVKESGTTIEYIKNPSEKVQLAAVRENWRALGYIRNPTKKVEQEVIKIQQRFGRASIEL